MSKNLRQLMKAAGPAVQTLVAAAMSANELADQASVDNFVRVLKLAIKAKDAGIDQQDFIGLMNAVRQDRSVTTSYEIELAGAIASQTDDVEGEELTLAFTAGGSIAGFGLDAAASYNTNSRSARSERSNENFRITARGSSFPESKLSDPEFVASVTAFVYRLPAGVTVPELPDDAGYGDIIEKLLPLAQQLILPPGSSDSGGGG